MLLSQVVATSRAVASTRSRNTKQAALAEAVAAMSDVELDAGLAFLAGHPRRSRIEVGWATVSGVETPVADEATLTIGDVDAAFMALEEAGGEGAQERRREIVAALLAAATADEQEWLRAVLVGDVRQGASDALVTSAIAAACDVSVGAVRRAVFLTDDPGLAARAARNEGEEGLAAIDLTVGSFVQPMLAATAEDVETATAGFGTAIVDVKLDGARVQVHVDGDDVVLFSRRGNDVTARLPDVVAFARSLDVGRCVLDGEAIGRRDDGSTVPFPETMGRFGSETGSELALHVTVFDVLAASGGAVPTREHPSTVDLPLDERLALLDAIVPEANRAARLRTQDPTEARAFAQAAVDAREEGVMVKDPTAPYAAGRRGSAWRKAKPVHTLDLVALACEWGSGRRTGWLSNLHLGAYDPDADGWVMLGKTFKGLTDQMLEWQTAHLLDLEDRRTRRTVHVRPALVIEVALDGFVRSDRYPAGVAMRFARVLQHRPDKDPRDADTVATCLGVLDGSVRPTLP